MVQEAEVVTYLGVHLLCHCMALQDGGGWQAEGCDRKQSLPLWSVTIHTC